MFNEQDSEPEPNPSASRWKVIALRVAIRVGEEVVIWTATAAIVTLAQHLIELMR